MTQTSIKGILSLSLYTISVKIGYCCLLSCAVFSWAQGINGENKDSKTENSSDQPTFYVTPGAVVTNRDEVYIAGSSAKTSRSKGRHHSKHYSKAKNNTEKTSEKKRREQPGNEKLWAKTEFKTTGAEHMAKTFSEISHVGICASSGGQAKKKFLFSFAFFLGLFLYVFLTFYTEQEKNNEQDGFLQSFIYKKNNIRPPPVCF